MAVKDDLHASEDRDSCASQRLLEITLASSIRQAMASSEWRRRRSKKE